MKICPYCNTVGQIRDCFPFSTDASVYYVCKVCDAQFEPYEYEKLEEDEG